MPRKPGPWVPGVNSGLASSGGSGYMFFQNLLGKTNDRGLPNLGVGRAFSGDEIQTPSRAACLGGQGTALEFGLGSEWPTGHAGHPEGRCQANGQVEGQHRTSPVISKEPAALAAVAQAAGVLSCTPKGKM